ncbi:MAG: transglutaminase domain-containing protein [Candidatus Omnitrophica bacterium]|nr:transglutaminase domain-containing protein [Candidatus Omnitrophota bacterium]
MFFLFLCPPLNASDYKDFRPSISEIRHVVFLVSAEYKQDIDRALRKAGRNACQLMKALEATSPEEREGMSFLIAHMPGRDLVRLKAEFLIKNVHLAYKAWGMAPWGKQIPKDIFFNEILPYASLNERRDSWREDFYQRFMNVAQEKGSIREAVKKLNKYVFDVLKVSYNPVKRPKPDQSPYESLQAHYASCTGLSILLVDALRAVGIPARITGIAMWADESGNHTWVEVWDGNWHYIGAAEPGDLDHAWFTQKAACTDKCHPIYAVSFKKTSRRFPMRWAPGLKFVSAEDVTARYSH